jgi:F-type H+-transporting ATPase subunit gamma
MAKTRDLKRRIRSVENTRQITKTMEMVAASKLKRAQDRVVAARPFDDFMRQVIGQLRRGAEGAEAVHPLLRDRVAVGRAGMLVITSNRGLAGAFNANLVRTALQQIRALSGEGLGVELHVVGKKGASMLRYMGSAPDRVVTDLSDRPSFEEADKVAVPLVDAFVEGRLDAVWLIYSHFRSPVEQRPVAAQLLPLPVAEEEKGGAEEGYVPIYEFLPSPVEILARILPLYVRYGVYRAIIESAASEHGARRTAMKNATDNAQDIIKDLKRSYNRARQTQITQEIAELVGGAEALKG